MTRRIALMVIGCLAFASMAWAQAPPATEATQLLVLADTNALVVDAAAIEVLLGTIDADTGALALSVGTIGTFTGLTRAVATVEVDPDTGDPVTFAVNWAQDTAFNPATFDAPGTILRALTTPADQATSDDSFVAATSDHFGAQRVLLSIGGVDVAGVEDVAETAGAAMLPVACVRRDTAASSAGTSGDYATCNTDGLGRLWAREGGPCADPARITHAAIEESTAAINEIVALNGSDLIYVCSYKWVTTAANSLQWVRGTGSDCGTGTTDIEGPQPYGANGGVAESNGGHPLFVVAAGNALCLQSSAATAHGGRVSYVRTAAP